MSENLQLTVSAKIPNGPSLSVSKEISIEAYDKIDFVVEAAETITVEVQPNASENVLFFLIRSNRYGDELTYQVNGAGPDIPLDTPHSFIGKGSVSLFGGAPESLKFTNGLTGNAEGPANVEILVGRKAIV